MQVKTFTSFWTMEKKLYAIYDWSLPAPIPLRVVGVFALVGIPWWVFLGVVHFPFGTPWYLVWLIPPGFLAWFGSRPIFEGKTLFQYALSRIKFLFENRRYKGLDPDLTDYEVVIEQKQSTFSIPNLRSVEK